MQYLNRLSLIAALLLPASALAQEAPSHLPAAHHGRGIVEGSGKGSISPYVAAVHDGEIYPGLFIDKGRTDQGSATIAPEEGISGEFGTWTVRYVVGKRGIKTGGGIAVELPKNWYSGPRNSLLHLQTTDPKANNYLTASTSDPQVAIKMILEGETKSILMKWDKPTMDGRAIRYVYVVRVVVERGQLRPGDVISVVFGNRSKGSAGYEASAISEKARPVLIGLDSNGNGHFELLEKKELPEITALPGAANDMWAFLPSQAVVGKPVTARVSLVDENANPIDHAVVLQVYQKTGKAEFPHIVNVEAGKGYAQFQVTPLETGILRLRIRTADFALEAITNPAEVTKSAPKENIYWGDIHSHTHFSWDGIGRNNFYYARYISNLNFYAMSDHSFAPRHGLARGLNRSEWARYAAIVNRHNDPGKFVTIVGYEDSMGAPYGHRNVYFRGQPGPMAYPGKSTLPQLWAMLDKAGFKGDALTIPHHTGKMPAGIDFRIRNRAYQRNIEIYSAHGSSEMYDPKGPLAFEHSLFTSDAKSLSPSYHQYAQDAWEMGQKLSTIASSDNHHAHPGQPQYGLTAVSAPALTRNDIFQGFYDRMTYGTTGARIILHFSIDGVPMGQTLKVKGTPDIKIGVVGTGPIAWVDLLRYRPGDKTFRVIKHWVVKGWSFNGEYRDPDFKPGAIYYCRVQQKYKIRRRVAMAWSSPIWTKK